MKPYFTLFAALIGMIPLLEAQEVNYSEHIAPIIYNNCTTCHRPGEIGPMSFTNYQEVKDWAGMINYVTEIRYMPPWKADVEFSRFLDERYLTEEEIQLIKDWVNTGTPQGDPALEPPLPEFPTGSQVGEPDLVLSFAESYPHYGGNEDEYRVFVLPTGLTEDKEISTVELRPGNTRIVHHALFTYDTTGEAQEKDEEEPGYGYDGFGGFGITGSFNRQFPAYVPGQKPRPYPEGLGQILPAGSDFLIQMHYAPVPFEEEDSSTVNIFYKEEPIERLVESHVMLPFFGTLENGPFVIAPDEVITFHGIWEIEEDLSLLGIAPHMHLIGQGWEVYLEKPDGDTTNLIRINEWDFNWQGSYNFKEFKIAPAGSKVHAFATYDNTAENPLNPNDPPKWVFWGERTIDEMYYLPINYVAYQEGDEDVSFEEEVTTSTDGSIHLNYPENKLYPVFPNPTQTTITVGFTLAHAEKVKLEIFDLNGQLITNVLNGATYFMGQHQLEVDVNSLHAGVYLIRLSGQYFQESQTFTVTK